jgi:hypothetical protein
MRGIDTVMKKTLPDWWYNYKKKKIYDLAKGHTTSVNAG